MLINIFSSVKGVYSLHNTNSAISAAPELNKPYVQGLSIRYGWKNIQPTAGSYNWIGMDQALALCRKAIIRVVAGTMSPAWVECQKTTTSPAIPYPWDEAYLKPWLVFIKAFGQRYNGNKTVQMVQMTGGGLAAEMFLGKQYVNWPALGYTKERIVGVWKQIIDAYAAAFPKKRLGLNIGAPLRTDYEVLDEILTWAIAKYPLQIVLQYNGLHGRDGVLDEYDKRLKDRSKRVTVGYQTTGSTEWNPENMGDYRVAFEKAVLCGASYLELYDCDLLNESLAEDIVWVAGKLK